MNGNRVPHNSTVVRVASAIRLNDGTMLVGTINCGMSGQLSKVLNSENAFVEFISREGQQRFISRHQIASVEPIENVRAPTLPHVLDGAIDPYQVLGLRTGTAYDAAKATFQKLSEMFNIDRWTGDDIPPEFTLYAKEKLKQINTAFTLLRSSHETTENRRAIENSRTIENSRAKPAGGEPLFGSRPSFGAEKVQQQERPQPTAPAPMADIRPAAEVPMRSAPEPLREPAAAPAMAEAPRVQVRETPRLDMQETAQPQPVRETDIGRHAFAAMAEETQAATPTAPHAVASDEYVVETADDGDLDVTEQQAEEVADDRWEQAAQSPAPQAEPMAERRYEATAMPNPARAQPQVSAAPVQAPAPARSGDDNDWREETRERLAALAALHRAHEARAEAEPAAAPAEPEREPYRPTQLLHDEAPSQRRVSETVWEETDGQGAPGEKALFG